LEFGYGSLRGVDIGEGEGEHCPPNISATFEGRIDPSNKAVASTGKYIGLPGSKFFGPKTAKDIEFTIISGKFIGFKKNFPVIDFNWN
jgi:hypothetical protein